MIITLHGSKPSSGDLSTGEFGSGFKVIAVEAGGQVDIYGAVRRPTWTFLAADARVGDTFIEVVDAVSWAVGDEIILASTDFDQGQTERFQVQSVSQMRVTLNRPISYFHYGHVYRTTEGDEVDMRAEVGSITRNIVLRSDPTDNASNNVGWGGHLIRHAGAELRISGVEAVNMGQSGVLGRYPIHFHTTGPALNDLVRENSVHDTFQRCIVLHGTQGLMVKDNVAFNSTGHCFFIEDGWETLNVLDHNLAVYARPHNLLVADNPDLSGGPAMFWVTHPSNYLRNNAAVGGVFGYWYSIPRHPTGAGLSRPIMQSWNQFAPILEFKNNRAHTTYNGFFMDKGLSWSVTRTPPTRVGLIDLFTSSNPRYLTNRVLNSGYARTYFPNMEAFATSSEANHTAFEYFLGTMPAAFSYVDGLVAHHCLSFGVWARGSRTVVINSRLADNLVAVQMPGENILLDSVVVGESDNVGTPYSASAGGRSRPAGYCDDCMAQPIIGWRNYDAGGPSLTASCRFYNFRTYTLPNGRVRPAAPFGQQNGPNILGPHNRYLNAKLYSCDNPLYFEPTTIDENAPKSAVYVDVDGTVSGTCGAYLVHNLATILRTPQCQAKPAWNAYFCPPAGGTEDAIRSLFFNDANAFPFPDPYSDVYYGTGVTTAKLVQASTGNFVTYPGRQTSVLSLEDYLSGGYLSANVTRSKSFSSNVRANNEYVVSFPRDDRIPALVDVGAAPLQEGEWIRIGLPYPAGTTFTVSSTTRGPLTLASGSDGLSSSAYWVDSVSSLLWLHIDNSMGGVAYLHSLNYTWLGGTHGLRIVATCPGYNATSKTCPGVVPTGFMAPPRSSTGARPSSCERDGGILGGVPEFTLRSSVSPLSIFADTVNTAWGVFAPPGVNISLTATGGNGGGAGYQVDTPGPYMGLIFYIADQRVDSLRGYLDLSKYSHLELDIKLGSGDDFAQMGVIFQPIDSELATKSPVTVSLVDPTISLYPPSEFGWRTFRVPLRKAATYGYVGGIAIFAVDRAMTFTVDNMRLVALDSSIRRTSLYETAPYLVRTPYPPAPTASGGGPAPQQAGTTTSDCASLSAVPLLGFFFALLVLLL